MLNHEFRIIKRFSFLIKWYDLWVGFYWDNARKYLYFFPLPIFGMIFKFKS